MGWHGLGSWDERSWVVPAHRPCWLDAWNHIQVTGQCETDVRCRNVLIARCVGISGAKMMYFLDKSRQEKAIAIATRLDETIRDKNVKVRFFTD